ncbi:MAG TPA: cytochrome c oxidase assembly protein [Solirubrobacteraceae bacterium]|jgi:putative copper resistance protein D
MSAPDLWTLGGHDWQTAPAPDLAAALSILIYVLGARRVRGGWPIARTASFAAGLAVMLIAVQSGYDTYDDQLLSAHMLQHLLLLELAPLLLLGGRPVMLALRAAPARRRAGLSRALTRLGWVTHPLTCLAVFFVVVGVAHLPTFYDATLNHPLVHDGEHAAFLVAGLLMWWPVLDGDPARRRRLGGLVRLSYVMVAMLPMTLIGAYLNRAPTVVYPAYIAPDRVRGISAVSDQQHAGAIMWVIGSMVMIAVGIWQTMAALIAEERRHQRAERHLDALPERTGGTPT